MKLMRGGIMYKQGDIILIPFPYSDLTGLKKRPAIIISNSKLEGDDFICSLITSNSSKNGILIKDSNLKKIKLPFKSWIRPQRLFTIDKKIIIKKLTCVKSDFFSKIEKNIFNFIKKEY